MENQENESTEVIVHQTSDISVPQVQGQATKFCSSCGGVIFEAAKICPNCGVEQNSGVSIIQPSQSTKFCSSCGNAIFEAAKICPNCGVEQKKSVVGGRSKGTAALLALLLGSVGIHKFYLGKTGLGIVYILFCWTLVPFLISIVEGIIYLCISDDEFNAKYNK